MKRKVLHIGFVALALFLCLCLSIGMAITGPSQAGANEKLSEFPKLRTEDEGLNPGFLTQFSDWVDDRFFLRQELISVDHWISGKLFRTSGDSDVILGENGWLYYADTLADYTGTEPMSERDLFSAAKNLSLMSDYCRENDRKFLFVIAPNKNSLYDENMPDFGCKAKKTDAERLLERLNSLNVDTVDLFSAFGLENEVLYFAHDSHWNTKGAALGADLINASFNLESNYYKSDFSQTTPHSGDLYQMVYPAFDDAEKDYICGRELDYSFTSSATKPDAIVLSTESDGQGSLLAYRDSFGNLLFPYLADTFETAKFSRSATYDLTGEAEYVLIELVERNLDYLIKNLPVIPAPEAEVTLPEKPKAAITVSATERGGLLQVKGQLTETDDDSEIYVVCGNTAYEAFCLADGGFGAYLDITCVPEYVMCRQGGAPVMYEIQIQE